MIAPRFPMPKNMEGKFPQEGFDHLCDWYLNRELTAMFGPNWRERMNGVGCYGCETGMAQHHQDGAKSWIECECGKLVGPKIDMSDANHVQECLDGWNKQALEFIEYKQLSEQPTGEGNQEGAPLVQDPSAEQTNPVQDDENGQGQPPDDTEVTTHTPSEDTPQPDQSVKAVSSTPAGYGGLDPVDVHANTNTDLPVEPSLDLEELEPTGDASDEVVPETVEDQNPQA